MKTSKHTHAVIYALVGLVLGVALAYIVVTSQSFYGIYRPLRLLFLPANLVVRYLVKFHDVSSDTLRLVGVATQGLFLAGLGLVVGLVVDRCSGSGDCDKASGQDERE